MNQVVTLTSKRQVTFPKKLLEFLAIDKGDRLLLKIEDDRVMLEPVKSSISDLQGELAQTAIGKKYSLEEVVKKAEKQEVQRLMSQL